MQRRSFFGVVFGGLLAIVLRRPRGARRVHDEWFKGDDPRKRIVTYAEMQRAYEAAVDETP